MFDRKASNRKSGGGGNLDCSAKPFCEQISYHIMARNVTLIMYGSMETGQDRVKS